MLLDEDALSGLGSLRAAVIGDLMLDRFVHGEVERISPEAPVPVVRVGREEARLGGAANVAANLAALGVHVEIAGVIGPGEAGDALLESLRERGIGTRAVVRCPGRVTTVKTRILGGGQQIVRIDRESAGALDEGTRQRLSARLEAIDAGVWVVSDYGKGVVDEVTMEVVRARHREGRPVICDPKQGDFGLYRQTTCITPNAREAGGAQHDRVDDDLSAERVGSALRERLELDLLLLTRGEQGMTLVESGAVHHLPTVASQVFDVTGAGDTVLAVFSALLGTGAGAVHAARVANVAAGLVVREVGTATVDIQRLRTAWREHGQ